MRSSEVTCSARLDMLDAEFAIVLRHGGCRSVRVFICINIDLDLYCSEGRCTLRFFARMSGFRRRYRQ